MTAPEFAQPADAPDGVPLDGGLIEQYRRLSAQLDEISMARDQIRARIEATLGDHETGLVNGKPAVSFAWTRPAERIDSRRLRAEQPELWAAYAVTGAPSRRFRLLDPEATS